MTSGLMDAFMKILKRISGFVFKTHAIVNSVSSDLMLERGPLSQAVLEKAGPELQEELTRVGQRVSVRVGAILQTSGCNLNSRHVFHVVTPHWKRDNNASSLKVGLCIFWERRSSLNSSFSIPQLAPVCFCSVVT